MKREIEINKEFYIISRKIDNAEKCYIVEINEDCFKVKLKHSQKYEIDEAVELFTLTSKGQLYFESIVKDVENDIISIWFPISSKYLQRREYSRILTDSGIKLYNKEDIIDSKVLDISAGGLKILTKSKLEILKEYKVCIFIDNKEIQTDFIPIRIEYTQEGFISSGKFKNINNQDKISLVQYCFKKQIDMKLKEA